MDGPPKDDVKERPKDPPKEDVQRDPPQDDRPPREEEYRDTDRYRRSGRYRDEFGRDEYRDEPYRGSAPQRQPTDMGAIFPLQRIGLMALLGIILLLIGAMLATSSIITETEWDDADDYNDDVKESKESYKNSLYIAELGMLLIALPMLGGGLLNDRIDMRLRIGMIVAGSIVVFALFSAIANGVFLMGA